jgi:hypothetical protein
MRDESNRSVGDPEITVEHARKLQTNLVEFAFMLPFGDPIREACLDVVDAIWERELQKRPVMARVQWPENAIGGAAGAGARCPPPIERRVDAR